MTISGARGKVAENKATKASCNMSKEYCEKLEY